jgi:hypothetical protein
VVGVRIADDDRARIPFALVAVILLLGAATFAATLRSRHPGGADPDPGAAVDRAESATRTLLATAVDRAARAAGREPVVTPANTTYGRVLNDSTPFRDYLRIRIYLAARRALSEIDQGVGDVSSGASLPSVENADDLRRAKRTVGLDSNGTTLEVTFENVTFAATRNGRTLELDRRTVKVGVENPVLVLHDRTETYETRLNRGPLEGPGLGRRLSAWLYVAGYARGYAFWGGAPVENVIGNRHVELTTNGAMLGVQRRTFGSSDDAARSVFQAALLQVGLRDLVAPVVASNRGWWVEFVTGYRPPPQESIAPYSLATPESPSPEDPMTVEVNRTADVAFARLFGERGNRTLPGVVRRTYAANATVVSTVRRSDPPSRPPSDPPSEEGEWRLVRNETNVTRSVSPGVAPLPAVPEGFHGHATFQRRVFEHYVYTWYWRYKDRTTTTTTNDTATALVGLGVVDDHAPNRLVPDRPIDPIHERGGPLDGANLLWVPENATERLIAARGGVNALARRAAAGTLDVPVSRIEGVRPSGLREWIYRDLASLRERIRNVSVSVPRGKLGTSVNGPRRLAEKIGRRRGELVDVPDRYRGVADKTRAAARAAYVESVLAVLRDHADRIGRTQSGLDEALADHDSSRKQVETTMASRDRSDDGGYVPTDDGPLRVTVDGSPSYLPLAAVDHDTVHAVEPGTEFHALVAENVNLFTVPYGEAGKAVVEKLGKSRANASLGTAARTLRSAKLVAAATNDSELSGAVERLRDRVGGALDRLLAASSEPVETATGYTEEKAVEVMKEGLERFDGTANRTLAALDGSAVGPIVRTVEARANLTAVERDLLRTELRSEFPQVASQESVRVGTSVLHNASNATRTAVDALERGSKRLATDWVKKKSERLRDRFTEKYSEKIAAALKRRASRLFPEGKLTAGQSGLPVLPSPTHWYFTTNVWVINVEGTYARFTVRARGGGPSGRGMAYTRDGEFVGLDVDDDGDPDRLGNASRVSFSTESVVLVVVPPGRKGVGDVNGVVFEQSPGWCTAGPVEKESDTEDEC